MMLCLLIAKLNNQLSKSLFWVDFVAGGTIVVISFMDPDLTVDQSSNAMTPKEIFPDVCNTGGHYFHQYGYKSEPEHQLWHEKSCNLGGKKLEIYYDTWCQNK